MHAVFIFPVLALICQLVAATVVPPLFQHGPPPSPPAEYCHIRNANAALAWKNFVIKSTPFMNELRAKHQKLSNQLSDRSLTYVDRLNIESQLLVLEKNRVNLWFVGAINNPELAMNPYAVAEHLPNLSADKRVGILFTLELLQYAMNIYTSLLDDQIARLKQQRARMMSSKNRFSRFFLRSWYAIRNWFGRRKKENKHISSILIYLLTAMSTQFLRYCDYKLNLCYETLGLSNPESAITPKSIQKAYRQLSLIFHPDKHVRLPSEEQAEKAERFKRVNAARNFLLLSENERTKVNMGRWKFDDLELIMWGIYNMQWNPDEDKLRKILQQPKQSYCNLWTEKDG